MIIEPTVFVIDDDPAALDSIAALVRSKGVRAEKFASAAQFLATYESTRTGCLVVDFCMPGMHGLELQRMLVSGNCRLPIIVVTDYANVGLAVQVMDEGAYTLVEKNGTHEELWNNIEQALAANAAGHLEYAAREGVECRLATLSAEETVVLDLLIAGRSNKQIAAELLLGLRTVELRRARVLAKMNAASLPQLVNMVLFAKDEPRRVRR